MLGVALSCGLTVMGMALVFWNKRSLRKYINEISAQTLSLKHKTEKTNDSGLIELEHAVIKISDLAAKQIDESCSQMDVAMTDLSTRFAGLVDKLDSSIKIAEAAAGDNQDEVNIFEGSREKLSNITNVMSDSIVAKKLMFEQVRELADQVEQLKTMAESVERIASQTNLLALNAAIEAARAGEMGRGLAVVADEVRALSKQSGKTGMDISELVNNISNAMDSALSQVDEFAKEDMKVETESKQSVTDVLSELHGVTEGLKESSATLRQNSKGIQEEIYEVLQSLQFHDRINQILTHVRDSFTVFCREVEVCQENRSNGIIRKIDEGKMIESMRSGYVTREQHILHEGGEVSSPQNEGVDFF